MDAIDALKRSLAACIPDGLPLRDAAVATGQRSGVSS